jgi:hypothetical protein
MLDTFQVLHFYWKKRGHDRFVSVGYGCPFPPAFSSLAYSIRAETRLEVRRKILRNRRWHRVLLEL